MSGYRHIDVEFTIKQTQKNEKLAKEWYGLFDDELKSNRSDILKLWQAKKLTKLNELIHRLHGACCYCSAPQLKEISKKCEEKLNKKHVTIDQDDINSIISEIDMVKKDLSNYLSG